MVRLFSVLALGTLLSTGTAVSAATLRYDFDANHDADAWQASGLWKNGIPFDNAWRPEQVSIGNDLMTLTLDREVCDREDCLDEPYASGEYKTLQRFQFGRIEARMKPAKGAGLVSSLFTYSDPFGNTELTNPDDHDEIDIEFLGDDTTKVQFNYWKAGQGGHEVAFDLGFDAADSFNTFAFEWRSDRIDWYVNDLLAHSVTGDALPSIQGHIFANLWPVEPGVDFAGGFVYDGPVTAEYDWIAYTSLEDLSGVTAVPTPSLWAGMLGFGSLILRRKRKGGKSSLDKGFEL